MGSNPIVVDLGPPFGIPYSIQIIQSEISVPPSVLPKLYPNDILKLSTGGVRATLRPLTAEPHAKGGKGTITRAERTPAVGGPVCIKAPLDPQFSLCPEAILQWLSSETLKRAGIHGAIPAVYDMFQVAEETRFSMDYIEGESVISALLKAESPDSLWLQILAQVALVLGYLEETIHLDHRDLKADNLWIRRKPIRYTAHVGGTIWHLSAPFQVVILDFGFSCIGDEAQRSVVALSDGVLPVVDICPKEGRDLFQLIASTWSIPLIRERAGKDVSADMESLLSSRAANYMEIVKDPPKWPWWVYWIVKAPEFQHPPLHPVSLLNMLSHEWYPTVRLIGIVERSTAGTG